MAQMGTDVTEETLENFQLSQHSCISRDCFVGLTPHDHLIRV